MTTAYRIARKGWYELNTEGMVVQYLTKEGSWSKDKTSAKVFETKRSANKEYKQPQYLTCWLEAFEK